MSSNVLLPQALFLIPRNAQVCAPTNLGSFSATGFGRPPSSSFSEMHLPVLKASSGCRFGKLSSRQSFVLLAGARSDGAELGNVENREEIQGLEAGAEVQEDFELKEKPPRINLGSIMGILNERAIEESDKVSPRPDVRTGDIVEIKMEFPDAWRYVNPAAKKHQLQGKSKKEYKIYKGIVISRQNAGIHTTIRIRRIIAGVGVEIVFPLYSPNIKEIKVVRHRKVRRARLYYLREKLPRFSIFK